MTYEFLKTSVEERVAWIEYQRPPLNAIDWKEAAKFRRHWRPYSATPAFA